MLAFTEIYIINKFNNMTLTDWIGFTGVAILLAAYLLNLIGVIKNKLIYLLLNFIGAAIACYASIRLNFMPFVLLEACWALVSAFGILSYFRKIKP